ncbi:hypothetical protein PGR6_03140 [Pseudomonas sp. GR 6-02]|nr:hypothetical protein PGR6_03140 [Pseudomonas sp. GR 6-02]
MHREPQLRTATRPKSRVHLQEKPYRKNTKAPEYGAFSATQRFFIPAY